MKEIDYIKIVPDEFGWKLRIEIAADTDQDGGTVYYGIGDVFQFVNEVDRTLALWIADGPADFHAAAPYDQQEDA